MTPFRTVDPNTGSLVASYDIHPPEEVEARLARSQRAYEEWRVMPVSARAARLSACAGLLRERATAFGALMAREMGKPHAQGVAEANKCASVCRHYADHAEAWLAPEPIASDASRSFVRYDPLGLVLAVMPWNFPFWQVFRFGAPALMAGNGFVVKHAPNVPGCALAIEQVCADAGMPAGLVTNLFVDVDAVSGLIADPRIAAVTVTGSNRAGEAVAAAAGGVSKKSVLELGGNDPFLVLADADLDRAAQVAADARLLNAGQSCIAAKRFIVEEAVAGPFLERFEAALGRAVVGDSMEPTTTVGPLAREDLRDALHGQVRESVAAGAGCRMGGEVPAGPGWFYPVTLLAGARPGMRAWDEEVFGPVAALRVVGTAEEAVADANASRYGLGASVWTRDLDRAERLAAALECGCVFVNGMVKSDPRLPFGGIKRSGYGRELSWHGLREFVNTKTVWIA